MRLAELQRALHEAVLGTDAAVLGSLRPAAGRPVAEQLAVVRGSVLGILTTALASTYPVCRALVGERFFDAMVTRFVRETPSRSPDLHDFGGELGTWIAGFAPAASVPYLPDVARLEWAWHRVFHGPDGRALDLAALAAVPAERQLDLIFELPAASALIRSPYPVHRIWLAHQSEPEGEASMRLDEGGVRLLVWRQPAPGTPGGSVVRLEPLEPAEWLALDGLRRGLTLGELVERAARQDPPEDVATLLPSLVARGWIDGFRRR